MSMHKENYKAAFASFVEKAREYPKVTFLILGIVFGSVTVLLLA